MSEICIVCKMTNDTPDDDLCTACHNEDMDRMRREW